MVKVRLVDKMHDGELLTDKIHRLRYPNYPDDMEPQASYKVISKYLNIKYNTVIEIVKAFRKQNENHELITRLQQE